MARQHSFQDKDSAPNEPKLQSLPLPAAKGKVGIG